MTRSRKTAALDHLAGLVEVPANAGARAVIGAFSDKFAAMADRLEDHEIAMFDIVFMEVVREGSSDDKALLAERFAPISKAPPRLVITLADDDDIGVAGPLLRQSKALSEENLIDLARRKGEAHLKAMAQRPNVPPALSREIVERNLPNAMVVLVDNPGARVDQATKAKIVQAAFGHPPLFIAVDRHSDLGQIILQAYETQQSGASRLKADADAVVAGFVGEGKIDEALAVIAMEARTRHRVVTRAYKQDTLESFVLIARAANLSWGTMIGLLLNQFGMSTSASMINEGRRLFDDTTRREALHKAKLIAMADKALRG